ncbi:MAG TPA: MarR family winged helix-turn-helix transcriptional regulator [Candidatus Limnocylindrales bacterium]|nr:MarR family winged helix-turn-helix transcriptional regulator [Candidatus Limnocylindrales bacterium]
MSESAPRRLTLLYQLHLAGLASRAIMRLAMEGTGMSGEEYALYSYFRANGPRTLTQAAQDMGMPVTTLATMLSGPVAAGEIARSPHPRDGRARLLNLTDAGQARWESAVPSFAAAYESVLEELARDGVELEPLFSALDQLRAAIASAAQRVEMLRASATSGIAGEPAASLPAASRS